MPEFLKNIRWVLEFWEITPEFCVPLNGQIWLWSHIRIKSSKAKVALLILQPSDSINAGQLIDTYGLKYFSMAEYSPLCFAQPSERAQ